MSEKLKVVFDTQVFLRSLIKSSSASSRLVRGFQEGRYTLYIADETEAEIIDVLNRPEIRTKFPQITDELVQKTLESLKQAQRVILEPIDPISRDPKDDIFLACAKAAQADYLVSEDKDLLVLESYLETKIVNVIEFLTILDDQSSKD